MASLSWKNLIPNIKILPTQKLFFKQYLYKLELLAYGGQCITTQTPIDITLEFRKKTYRTINYGGSWGAKINANLINADLEWLQYLQSFKHDPRVKFKIRVEEPNIQFYSSDEQELLDFVNNIDPKFKSYVVSITRPKNDEEQKLLESGKKIVKKSPAYRYKIAIRDGKYNLDVKQQVLNYLDNLGDLVRIPNHFRSEFTKSYSNTWDCYIYSNDVNITTFMQLIDPYLIRTITEMASVEDINTDIIQGGYNGQNT